MATAKLLVVAGGGAGGKSGTADGCAASGGGAGGLIFNATYTVTAGDYGITVGAGAVTNTTTNSNGTDGSNSVFDTANRTSIQTATGGGGGARDNDGTPFNALLFLFSLQPSAFASDKWQGVDESVIEKVAKEHGREAREPLINTDQGDLLLFVFLLAGTIGGFTAGYYWKELTGNKGQNNKEHGNL